MPKTLTLSDLRDQLLDLSEKLLEEEVVVITRHARPVMVALGFEQYESLMETLEILSDPIQASQIVESIEQVERGETIGYEEVKRRLGL